MSIRKLPREINLFQKKAENKKLRYIVSISLIFVMSFILFYAGHFLFYKPHGGPRKNITALPAATPAVMTPAAGIGKEPGDAVVYTHKTEVIDGFKQEINILEVDPGAPGIRIQPVLSHDVIYGFELLSEMAARKNAYAAVNGGFFSKYGLPSGMVVIDGETVSAATGRYPVFSVENGKASLKDFKSVITVKYGAMAGDTPEGAGRINVNRFNAPAGAKDIAVYTPYYGRTNRAEKPNITATVVDGTVHGISFCRDETEIPRNGFLISFFDTGKYSVNNLPIKAGDGIKIIHEPATGSGTNSYECGSWLVRNGKPVVPLKDPWVGIMTNRDPRTAVGIKENGNVVLLTVDGRQPGYSAGFTGQELARYLISLGVKDAAMLDGGASTEMLVKGRLAGRPSYNGEERALGGGILVLTGK